MANHHEVAHAWAHQTGKQRNGKRMFYEGDRIYSHGRHFLIARLLDVKGVPSVLFTTRDDSVSTNRHKAIARGAIRHLPIHFARDPGHFPDLQDWEEHLTAAHQHAAKSKRCRIEYRRDHELSLAQSSLDLANSLNSAFDLKQATVTLETLGLQIADREARIAKARKRAEKERRRLEKERFAREAEQRAAWLAGSDNAYYRGTTPDGSAILRVKGDMLETSLGASVPLAHAVKAFRFIKLVKARAEPWHRNGHSVRVGNFTVDTIDETGNIHAGCHFIAWPQIEAIAKTIGIVDEAASDEALQLSSNAA